MLKPFRLFSLVFFLVSSTVQAAIFQSSAPISGERDCFSGPFVSYDTWLQTMSEKYERKYAKDKEADKAYKIAKDIQRFKAMFSRSAFEQYQASIECSYYTYNVGEVQVKGFAIKPKVSAFEAKKVKSKLPVLIYNRGGNGNFGGVVLGHMMSKLFPLAKQNFIIIGSQYRGTFNRNSTAFDEFGGEDVEDVVALGKLIPYLRESDQDNIGMFGASRGGMQTFLALKRMPEVHRVAIISGVSDLLSDLDVRPDMEKVYKIRIPNYKTQKQQQLKARSVMYWLDELDQSKPILLIHGEQDRRVHVRNAKQLAIALRDKKHPHKLVIYPEGSHSLIKEGEQMIHELASWFDGQKISDNQTAL